MTNPTFHDIDIQQQIDIENQIQVEVQERREYVRGRTYLLVLSLGCFTVAGYTAYYEYLLRITR